MNNTDNRIDTLQEVRTSIAGSNSGPEAEERQEALQYISKYMEKRETPFFIDLVPDPENKFDPNAIQLIADVADMGGRIQLGYVRNRPSCNYCHREFTGSSLKIGEECPNCRRGKVERVGLASKLAESMRNGNSFYAQVDQVTGGTGEKTLRGCNLIIRRRAERRR